MRLLIGNSLPPCNQTNKLLGCKFRRPRPALQQNIVESKHTLDPLPRFRDRHRVKIKPKIVVWARTRQYEWIVGYLVSWSLTGSRRRSATG